MRVVMAVALALSVPLVAEAQEPVVCADSAAAAAPDVVIAASAQVRELRFESRPEIRVGVAGCPGGDAVRVVERRNLPDPVLPGVTYRDVFVSVEILGHLQVECLLRGLNLAAAARDTVGAAGMVSAPAPRCAGEERADTARRER